jgi:hypothetical protein
LARSVIILIVLLGASVAWGGQPPGTFEVGVRLGLFSNTNNDLAADDGGIEVFVNARNVYAEGFGAYYLARPLALVANLGSYSKGDIRFVGVDAALGRTRTFFGSAVIYPIQLGLRLDPFGSQLPGGLSPYFEGGGALIVGRESVNQLYYDTFSGSFVDGTIESETDWNWWAGGGLGLPLSEKIRLDFMVKYVATVFDGDIAGLSEFSGWQVTFGIGYFAVIK